MLLYFNFIELLVSDVQEYQNIFKAWGCFYAHTDAHFWNIQLNKITLAILFKLQARYLSEFAFYLK